MLHHSQESAFLSTFWLQSDKKKNKKKKHHFQFANWNKADNKLQ